MAMHRKRFALRAGVAVVLCAGTVVLWVRSRSTYDVFRVRLWGEQWVAAGSNAGAVELQEVVDGLNGIGFRTPEGNAWSADRLAAEFRLLAE